MSDEEARRVYEEARIGGAVGLRERPCARRIDSVILCVSLEQLLAELDRFPAVAPLERV